ncbi:hypothetical protein O3M35_004003 [Rhynocoris fuscipes]|uniref:Ubiquitin-like domain-containing protein n=1 Tax=Rhynocoris fuscipes TaxID=488301 RepID=A0AAW1CI09_9HEMI
MNSEMVKIVIKAPNQMTDDQIIDCQRLWSVSELKEHLFKEYPTHPKPESQKLIYSGKLLSDNMILRDVLKTFGGHEYNTIHLVCSLRESYRARAQVPAPPLVKPVRTTPEPSFISNSPTNNFGIYYIFCLFIYLVIIFTLPA